VTGLGGSVSPSAGPALLGIETAGSRCSVAAASGRAILAAESRPMRHGHGEALMPMVDRVMAAAVLAPRQLGLVAAAIGPGGFTGIRAGLAAAQGIAIAIGARLIGVTGFAAVAHACRAEPRRDGAMLLVALDSRREDFYVQLFTPDALAPVGLPRAVLPDRLIDYLGAAAGPAPLLIAGDAAESIVAALSGRRDFEIVRDSAPDALGVVAAALDAAKSAPTEDPVRPLYLRPPDVTLPKPRGAPVAALR
jgi:tRNA threonylcarbamoyladenosine biosynthesis protein TsaB